MRAPEFSLETLGAARNLVLGEWIMHHGNLDAEPVFVLKYGPDVKGKVLETLFGFCLKSKEELAVLGGPSTFRTGYDEDMHGWAVVAVDDRL